MCSMFHSLFVLDAHGRGSYLFLRAFHTPQLHLASLDARLEYLSESTCVTHIHADQESKVEVLHLFYSLLIY